MANRTTWWTAAGLGLALAIALTFLLEPVDLPAGLHGPDGRNYLSLLHSLFFDGDLLLYDDNAQFGRRIIVTSTGYALELHNVGTALAFLPFYALGHLTCLVTGGTCAGDGLPYYAWLSLGNWAYGLLALILLFRLAERGAPRRSAAAAMAVLALGSPFFYYWTRFFSPHMPALALAALLTLVWHRTQASRAPHHWLLLGALGGLAVSVANYNVALLVLPASDLVHRLVVRRSVPVREGLLLLAGTLAGLAPQLAAWQLLFGSILGTPYGQQLFWLRPGLPDILFSSYHGLYFYAPALLIATVGFVSLWRQDRRPAAKMLLAFAALVYIAGCNIAWWGGASFGARYLLTGLPLLVMPLAALLARFRPRSLLGAALVACALWTYGLLLADFARLVDPGQYIPPRWQLEVQARVLAELPHLVQRHLLAPRFAAAPLYAAPFALLLTGLALAARRWRCPGGRGLTAALLALPLLAAGLLALSDAPSRREIDRLAAAGALDGFPRSEVDLYDLSEGYWQRGAYRFVRGDLDGARADFYAAHRLLPDRNWVRFHRGGRRHVPNPLDWTVDGSLALVGWEAEPGAVTLYWLAGRDVLAPAYRSDLRLSGTAGREVAAFAGAQPDDWRALAGDIVRATYPVPWTAESPPHILAVEVYAVGDGRLLGSLEVGFDEP